MRTITTLLLAVLLGTTHALGATETVTYYHNDALGSPVAATDEAGDVLWTQDYDAWGVTLQSHDNRRWYTGAERDEDTALTYLQARWYSAAIGRFLALDPVDFHDSNIHSFNRYAYGANNPYTYVDPDGNIPIPALVWGAVKVAGYGLAAYDAYQAYQGSGATRAAAAAGVNLIARPARAGRAVADGVRGARTLTAPRARGNPNTVPERGPIYVDSKGNAIPTPPGGRITGSPDGRFIQARDAAGNPTGVRIDGPHRPASHPDPRAQQPHGHVPGVTNSDGTPWLPIRK